MTGKILSLQIPKSIKKSLKEKHQKRMLLLQKQKTRRQEKSLKLLPRSKKPIQRHQSKRLSPKPSMKTKRKLLKNKMIQRPRKRKMMLNQRKKKILLNKRKKKMMPSPRKRLHPTKRIQKLLLVSKPLKNTKR